MKTLIVIDMQNDFIDCALGTPEAQAIVPNVKKKIEEVLDCDFSLVEIGDEVKKISVAECARIIGKSEQFVRVALQTGVAPFGMAVKTKSRYDYHISPKKLSEYMNM